jgi:UDP-glucose 4-epimerase|tara:strand:- start:3577 stop:4479 length:903 start_codon:yes stop_codon:yes gene_type:complete
MSKAIVTGGAGFIGSNLVDRILPLYNEVIVIDNESSDAHESFYWNKKCSNHKLDICDYKKIRPLFDGVEVVFHVAAEARIQPTIKNPILAATTNVVGTCTVLQCAREAGVKRVVYSSTSSAYGLKNEIPLAETMSNDCLNPYSVTKTSGEELCRIYTKLFGLETVIFRYFNVYGERHPLKGQYAPVIGIFLRQKNNNEPMTIVGTGEQRRDFTHVSDVVSANILASILENKAPVGETINIGTGSNHSILEIAEYIGGQYKFIESRLGEAKETQANIGKAFKILGWSPTIKVEDWIKSYES